ncbi:MAG: L,D-transpeptidase [Verrucomicrobiae bacterium]|nr:L,D-transpeptidase [Verrucomicrobiae bacterium]
MSRSFRIPRSALLLAGVSASLILNSCTTPTSGPTATRHLSGSTTSRHRNAVYQGNGDSRTHVEETTRENFFAWLFLTDESAKPKAKKKPTKPVGPVIPATKVHQSVLAQSTRGNTRIVVDISRQKAFLLVGGAVAIETPVSTARTGKYTPRGSFRISERVRSGKISTIYGVGMPYWMRLSGTVFGVHAGYLPGYPASAGCVRLPSDAAQLIFDNTKSGTPVSIYSAWDGA